MPTPPPPEIHPVDAPAAAGARRGCALALALAGVAAAGFVLLSSPRLEEQGLYYDELHQAPAAFLWLGRAPYLFTPVRWGKLPLLTMPYSGAAKSVLYGEWMRVSGRPFTIWSWRMLGILLAGSGLLAFLALSGRMLGTAGSAVFAALVLSDTALLLTSRHDWGPTAMALGLRLLWLGVWLRAEERQEYGGASAFLLGAIPAFLLYEKLSNAVFLVAPALVVASTPRLRTRGAWPWLAGGFLAGLAPLAAANVLGGGISFRAAQAVHGGRLPLLGYLGQVLSAGSGAQARSWLLGVETPDAVRRGEALLLSAAVAVAAARSVAALPSPRARAGLLCVASYAGVALATWLMPRTWLHHWVAASPLQYAALGLAFGGAASGLPRQARQRASLARSVAPALALLAALAAVRLAPLLETERALRAGASSPTWSPAYTRLARYAVEHRDEVLVLADWGFATAIYALSNGSLAPEEPFADYRGPDHLRRLAAGRPFHVVSRARVPAIDPAAAEAIRRDALLVAGGRRLPVPPELVSDEIEVLSFAAPAGTALTPSAGAGPAPAPPDRR